MKEGIILVVSKKMDKNATVNKRSNEHKLIRLGKRAREYLGLVEDKAVELWPDGTVNDRANRSRVLSIYQAYSADLKEIKKNMSKEDYLRVGFVTSNTFKYLCKNVTNKANIWLADSIDDIIIGADPEFALLDNNKLVYAGHIGLDYRGSLGADGPLAEIRPNPEIDVDQFINNIKNIVRKHKNLTFINKYSWYADPYFTNDNTEYGIGGHIHVGTPKLAIYPIESNSDHTYVMFGILHYLLNYFVAIPFMQIEGIEKSIYRRSATVYGHSDDFRTDRARLEYRVLSGTWLKHPTIAKAVIGTAKAVAEAYYKYIDGVSAKNIQKPFKFLNLKYLSDRLCNLNVSKELNVDMAGSDIRCILENGDGLNNDILQRIFKRLKGLPTYDKYSEYVDLFIELVKYTSRDGPTFSPYFKTVWKRNTKLKYVEE